MTTRHMTTMVNYLIKGVLSLSFHGHAIVDRLLQINKIFPELFIRSRRVRDYDDRDDNSICSLSDDTWTGHDYNTNRNKVHPREARGLQKT